MSSSHSGSFSHSYKTNEKDVSENCCFPIFVKDVDNDNLSP